MKLNFTLTIPLLLFAGLLFLGNENGRASQAGKGNTGAPGDETSPSGFKRTCGFCHASATIFSDVALNVLDDMGNPVTQYIPGNEYTAQLVVNGTGNGIDGYAFQMIALRDSGYIDIDGFTDVNPNNYKLATIGNGRTYAEHAGISQTDTFNVSWTAPDVGTGDITFYFSGNAVNGNGQSTGDGPSNDSLKMTEGPLVSSPYVNSLQLGVKPFGNPIQDVIQLGLTAEQSGSYVLNVFNLDGELMYSNPDLDLAASQQIIAVNAADWASGIYFVQLSGAGQRSTVKVVKL